MLFSRVHTGVATFLNRGMLKKIHHAGTALCLLLVCLGATGQTGQSEQTTRPPKITFERLVRAAKLYFRDTAEFPLLQKTTLTVSNSSGQVRENRTISGAGTFQGYRLSEHGQNKLQQHNQDENPWRLNLHVNMPFWTRLRGTKMMKVSLNSFMWTTIPGVVFVIDRDLYELEVNEPGSGTELLIAKLTPAKRCPPFSMKDQPVPYFPDGICGIAEFKLHEDLSFQQFAFEAPGLPVSTRIDGLGQCTLQRYHVEIEFQKVTLPGDKEPFLVPKQVTATLNTNKGNIVIASAYEPNPPKK